MKVLTIDIGGSHIKMRTQTTQRRRVKSGRAMTPQKMVDAVRELTAGWSYESISIGYPGVVMKGHIVSEPRNLGEGWLGFDFKKHFGTPTRIINDAAMQALGSYRGQRLLFLGLGTGLGTAVVSDGRVEAMELAHLPFRHGKTFEELVGDAARQRLGKKRWRKRVWQMVALLKAAMNAEHVVIGGGNARRLKRSPDDVRFVDNDAAFVGGFRLWDDAATAPRAKRAIALSSNELQKD